MKIGIFQTRATFVPESFNTETREIDLVFSTGARGPRWSWDVGDYEEELEITTTAIRMGRLNAGAPFLKDHNARSVDNVLGVIRLGWVEGNEAKCRVRLTDREDHAGVVADIVSGILPNVSVGYRVHKYELIEGGEGVTPVYRATDWEPFEVSSVTIPFDVGAQTRSAESQNSFDVEIVSARVTTQGAPGARMEETMEENETTTPGAAETPATTTTPAPEAPAPAAGDDQARNAGAVAERSRVQGITAAVRAARLDQTVADDLIARGVSLDQARATVIDQLAAAQAPTSNARGLTVTRAEADTRRAAMQDAIELRSNPRASVTAAQAEAARRYRGMNLIDMARQAIVDAGGNPEGMTRGEIAGAALNLTRAGGMHSTSDFPLILANTVNRSLRAAYEAAPQTFRPLVRVVSLADFKPVTRLQLGDAPKLLEVKEGGEYERGTMSESGESYSLKKFGRIIGVTRETLINDDLSALTRIPTQYGRAAANLESDLVWNLFAGNGPTMSDGAAMFAAGHKNLGTAAAIAVASVGESRKLLRNQKSLDGDLMNLQATYMVVPSTLETAAEQFLATILANQNSNVNPFSGKLQLIAEPRLDVFSATAWYTATGPDQIDTIELAYLEGQEGLHIETREGFEVDGVEIKARLDVAAAVIDHRGFVKNAGV